VSTAKATVRRRRAAQLIGPALGAVMTVAGAVAITHGPGKPKGAGTSVLGIKVEGNAGCGVGNNGGTKTGCTEPRWLTLTGSVAGQLVPGATRTLTVVVSNDNNQPVQVTKITAAVQTPTGGLQNTSLPACNAAWVSVGSYNYLTGAQLVAPAHGSVNVPLPILLTNQPLNQDNCKGANFTVGLAGEGSQVH